MASSNNNILITLASINVLGFVIILILFWMLWDNNQQLQRQNITVNYVPTQPPETTASSPQNQTAETDKLEPNKPEPSVNAEDLSIISAVAKEVISNNIGTHERLDLKIPKPAQKPVQNPANINNNTTDKKANNNGISGSKKVLSDKEYIAIFNEVNSKQKPVKREYSEEDASTKPADKKTTPANDHFNKVDVSKIKPQQTKILTLTQQVTAAVATNRKDITNRPKNSDGWKDYLSSLKEAETERQNEMRTITVRRGETLWKISTRAYGTGYSYKKIFAANPHLTSPDSISVGETLRVPL